MKLLVIEDADILRDSLVTGLTDAGYWVDASADGEEGLWRAQEFSYDLIILDIMLPKKDGFEILTTLRQKAITSLVLMLTARDDLEDRVRGLRCGADDYLVKPFDFVELLARVEALLRRQAGHASNRISLGNLTVDLAAKNVTIDEQPIALPRREYALLECLVLNQHRIVSRQMIEQAIYDDLVEPKSNVVDSAISSLRKFIDRPGRPSHILTRRGHGYQIQ